MPEELLERILLFALSPHPAPAPAPALASSPALSSAASRLAPLYTCRLLARIGAPHLYRAPRIRSARAARLLARTLESSPALARCVRKLRACASYAALAVVFRACGAASLPSSPSEPRRALELLDLTLDAGVDDAEMEGKDVEGGRCFGDALAALDVRVLVLRKREAYLTQERPKAVMEGLARAVTKWQSLTSVTIAFRLSDPSRTRSRSEPGSRPSTPPSAASAAAHPEHAAALASADADADTSGAPLTLPAALARSPRLRTLRASLPAVWNPALLRMSKNPALERIVLTVPRTRPRASPAHPMHVADASADVAEERVSEWDTDDEDAREEVLGWGSGPQLWMMEAKKHARLMELIKAGSPNVRARAHTLNTSIALGMGVGARRRSLSPPAEHKDEHPAPAPVSGAPAF